MTHARFQSADAATVAGWVRTPLELSMVDPDAVFPLTAGQVCAWAEHRTRAVVFSFDADGPLVGYGELQIAPRKGITNAWLCRVVVKPELRGCGVGTLCGTKLEQIARAEYGVDILLAWVAPQNRASLGAAYRIGLRSVRTDWVRGREFLRLEKDLR